MSAHRQSPLPCALTIAGSDSGGGAGIQADLKTFAALKVHGTTAITCLTAQNPRGVTGIHAATPEIVLAQIEAVMSELRPAAAKSGMLFSTEIIAVVIEVFSRPGMPPLIVDPVMVATSGAQLLQPKAAELLTKRLLPIAALVTPNLDEAEILVRGKLTTPEDLRAAARDIFDRFGCPALVKGGHLKRSAEAIDVFYDGTTELLLSAPFIKNVSTHGTGCTYSAAIAGFLARGLPLSKAVPQAKQYVTRAIGFSQTVGRHNVLNHQVPLTGGV